MAMTEYESEAHLENIPVETQKNFDDRPPEADQPVVHKNTGGVVLTNTSEISALTKFANETVLEAENKDVSPKSDEKETSSMEQVLVPSTSEPHKESMEMELQNEGEDEGFKGFESIDDIEIDDEQMLQIVNVISLCEHDDIMNANQSQLDDMINADQSQLEDIIADQCQLHDIIKEEPFQLEDNMTENQCMEMQQDLQCADLLSDISTFDQQKNNVAEKQSTDNTSNLHQSHGLEDLEPVCHNEHHVTEELQLLCHQGDSVTEDQRLMVAEANLRYGIPTVEYEVDHEESPVVEQPYLCTECRQRFSEHDDLEQHLWDHIAAMTGKHPHKCSKCPGRTFSDMKQHKRHHQMGLECDICGEAFHEAIILARHRMGAHPRSKAYPCKICKMTFTTRAELSQHKERHSKTKAFYCKMCSESFRSEVGLSVHMKTHSGSSKIRNIVREKDSPSHTSATKLHSCAHCRQDFISLEILHSHVKSEHSSASETNLICDVCKKSFLKLEDLKMHKATHSDNKLYKCEECEASFATKQVLKEHTLKHRDERKCQFCGHNSSSSSRLVKHMKKTHRDKIFDCKRCTKWFTSKEELFVHIDKEHKNVHKKEKSYSSDLSKQEGKDRKTLHTKDVLEEESLCESPCTTEVSLEDHEGSSSPDHSDSVSLKQDKSLEPPTRKAYPPNECREKMGDSNEVYSLEPLKKKLKEDTTSSSLESSTDTNHLTKYIHDDVKKSSESPNERLMEDQKSKSSDSSKERPKGDKKSDSESSKEKSRHSKQELNESSKEKSRGSKKSESDSSRDRLKDDEKSSGGKEQFKGFKIPKIRKSKEVNKTSESSEQPEEKPVEDMGPMSYGDFKDKFRDDKKSKSKSDELAEKEKKASFQESTKPPLNKIPLLATPPINKLPLLPTPVSNKIPLLATPNNVSRPIKKSRWGEPLKEDTTTVWAGPSRVQSAETNRFKTSELTDRSAEDKKSSWHESSKDRQLKKSRWGDPPKEDEVMMSSTSVEKSMEDSRLKTNPSLVGKSKEEYKSKANSPPPGQPVENNRFRSNQTPMPLESNALKLNATSSGRISEDSRFKSNPASSGRHSDDNRSMSNSMATGRPVEDSRFKSNPAPTLRPTEDDRLKSNPVPTGRLMEDSRFKSNPATTIRPSEDNRFKSNSVPTGRPVEDSRFKSDPAPTMRPAEDDRLKSNPVPTGRPTEDSRFKSSTAPTKRPTEDKRIKPNPVLPGRPIEDTRFKSSVVPLGWPQDDNRLKSKPASTERHLEDKFKLNPISTKRTEDNSLKTSWTSTTAIEGSTFKSTEYLEKQYNDFEQMIKQSMEKVVVDTKSIFFNSSKDKSREDKQSKWGETYRDGARGDSSYKSLIGPISKDNKSVEDESLQEDHVSIYSGSPMDMSIGNDDSSNDKSVEEIKEDRADNTARADNKARADIDDRPNRKGRADNTARADNKARADIDDRPNRKGRADNTARADNKARADIDDRPNRKGRADSKVKKDSKEDQDDEGLIWGASFIKENNFQWGKSFLEDQKSMLQESRNERAVEPRKPLKIDVSKGGSKTDLPSNSGKSSKEDKAACSKSLKDKSSNQLKSPKISIDNAQSVCRNSSKESSIENAQPVWFDPVQARPVEDTSMWYNSAKVQEMQSMWYNGPQGKTTESNKPIWASSSSERTAMGYVPHYETEWAESSTNSMNPMFYGKQYFQADSKSEVPELSVGKVKEAPYFNSVFAPERNLERDLLGSHSSVSDPGRNLNRNLLGSHSLVSAPERNLQEDVLGSHSSHLAPERNLKGGVLGMGSSQPEEESEENKGSNLSEMLEEWLKGNNKPDEAVQSLKTEKPKGFVLSRGMSKNSDEMRWGESANCEPPIEPFKERAVEDKKSNLSDMLEEWLKEHKK